MKKKQLHSTQIQKGTHVAQGGTPSPRGSHASDSSSSGHSAPSPTGNWSTCLVRVRLPLADSGSVQVFEQGPHSAQSVTWQSLGSTQGWTVSGRSLGVHRLGKDKEEGCREEWRCGYGIDLGRIRGALALHKARF